MKRLYALAALAALAFGSLPANARVPVMAETSVSGIRVWVTVYRNGVFAPTIIGSGWMSKGNGFPHIALEHSSTYKIRAQVFEDARGSEQVADTTASLWKRGGAPIHLLRRGTNYYWDY